MSQGDQPIIEMTQAQAESGPWDVMTQVHTGGCVHGHSVQPFYGQSGQPFHSQSAQPFHSQSVQPFHSQSVQPFNFNLQDQSGQTFNHPGPAECYESTHYPGISTSAVVDGYNVWANTYDDDLKAEDYNGPAYVAKAVSEHFAPDSSISCTRILDVAAGTGLVGIELNKLGFSQIDALEPSVGMLGILERRQLYGSIFNNCVGFGPIPTILSNSYDCAVICGGMGEGHVPLSALDELIRVVKEGGLVVIIMREEHLFNVEEYANKLEPYMDQLTWMGLWKLVGRQIVPNYSYGKNGVLFKFEILYNN